MTAVWVVLLLFLAITGRSSATYCVCKDGVGESSLQKSIDYACGNGANCSPIKEKGACYNPNTVKDHCNYAVNSYFQNKGQAVGSCNFSDTATTAQTLTGQSSTCVYPTSASSATPGTGTTPSTGLITPTTGSNSGTPFGMGPAGNNGFPDSSMAAGTLFSLHLFFWPFTLLTLFLSILLKP